MCVHSGKAVVDPGRSSDRRVSEMSLPPAKTDPKWNGMRFGSGPIAASFRCGGERCRHLPDQVEAIDFVKNFIATDFFDYYLKKSIAVD